MFDFLRNTFLNQNRYRTDSRAVIVACFFNPQNNPYRLLAFRKWYRSICHLNYRIIECLIGEDAKTQLPKDDPYITRVTTDSLLWHKESLLNKAIKELPDKFEFVFWVDTDVLFTNLNWLTEGVQVLEEENIIQPFEYCIHLEKNQLEPNFDVDAYRDTVNFPPQRQPSMWRSFCANYTDDSQAARSTNYDQHGHVGFAWGARRQVLEECPLYDRGLIGGADHIIAHAAAGQINHECTVKGFVDNLDEVNDWSRRFYNVVEGKIGYVPGDLYHIWHGDLANRQYLKRIKEFTKEGKQITQRDQNGLHVATGKNAYMRRYYQQREVSFYDYDDFGGLDIGFAEDMGYMIADLIDIFGQPRYDDLTIYDSPPVDVPSVQGQPPIDVDVVHGQQPLTGSEQVPVIENLITPAEIPESVDAGVNVAQGDYNTAKGDCSTFTSDNYS